MTITVDLYTLIWIPVAIALVIVLVGAIVMNLAPRKHADVDALAEQAAERAERERVHQLNAEESKRAVSREKLWRMQTH